jgi:DNA replication initiation complex subunit (GINS family)
MKVDYDELRRIYRLEKNTSKLVELQEDFYNSLNEFVQGEKTNYLDSLKDLSNSKAKDFNNLKKMLEEFFSIRQKKLLNQALIALHTGEFSEERLALQEKDLFRKVLSELQKHQKLFDEIFSSNGNHKENAKEKKDLNFVSVKILKQVPEFVGSDMKEYGPFPEQQTASLPYKVAKLLISKNLAELEEMD